MAVCHKCLLYGFVVWFLHEIQTSEYDKNEWNTKFYRDKTKYITIECRKKHLLTDIEVVAGKQTFDTKSHTLIDIYGKTPYLLKEVLFCYWNKVCRLAFPKDKLVMCVTLNSTEKHGVVVQENEEFSSISCYFQEVEFLRPIHANCIRKGVLKNLCERKKGKLNCKTKFSKTKGMIKSHESYPWYYDYQNLTHKFNFSLQKNKSLIIFIRFAHVCEDDVLTLRTTRGDINIADKEDNFQLIFTKRKHKFVELKFIAAPDLKPRRCGGGFLICYRAMGKKRARKYSGNICEDLYDKNMPAVKMSNIRSDNGSNLLR